MTVWCVHTGTTIDDGRTQKGHAMGRLLRPVDIAATVGHLLSDASAMMTGTIVDLHPEMASEYIVYVYKISIHSTKPH